jgi:N-acetylglucosamine-6-phosphate deacetylase
MRIINANIWQAGKGFVRGGVTFQKQIHSIEPFDANADAGALDAQGMYLIPGLVDVHVHGALGGDFSDADTEANDRIERRLVRNGVTSHLATTMTMPVDVLAQEAKLLNYTQDDPERSTCLGLHLEGPFLSYEKRGAQYAEYLQKPDYDKFCRINDASGGRVRLITVAPETEGAMEFIAQVSRETNVSLGHTTTDYETAMRAFSAGANHVTHLFNAMQPFLHRAPGLIGAAMDAGAYVELIGDGLHVHPAVIRAAFRMFPARLVLISDAVRSSGMPDGQYTLGGQDVILKNGKTTLPDGTLAGSNITVYEAIVNAVRFGISLEEAVEAVTLLPAISAGVDDAVGSIEPGKRADMLLLDRELHLVKIYHFGQEIEPEKKNV